MGETYCGKSCLDCVSKEALNCPGCRLGPGKAGQNDCDLAQCCRTRGHSSCLDCNFKIRCDKYARREFAPEDRRRRLKRRNAEQDRVGEVAKFTPMIARWMRILLWLVVPSTIASVFTNDTMRQILPILYIPGTILQFASNLVYCFVLFAMSQLENRYRKAGICTLIGVGISLLNTLCAGVPGVASLYSVLLLPSIILTFVTVYQECFAHSEMMAEVDIYVSNKWVMLWKAYLIGYLLVFGSIILLILNPVIGLIAMVVGAIGIVIASIAKLVLLHQSAKQAEVYTVMANKG